MEIYQNTFSLDGLHLDKEDTSPTGTLDTSTQMPYNNKVSNQSKMQDEFLTRCVVDLIKRTFYIYSSEGDDREIVCDTVDQFIDVLEVIRNNCPEDALFYAEPLEV